VIRFIALLLSLLVAGNIRAAGAGCQPDSAAAPLDNGDDVILCAGEDLDGLNGDTPFLPRGGNDVIVVEQGAVVRNAIFGDGLAFGRGGDDRITNHGTILAQGTRTGTNGDIEGDVVADGDGGDDVITNNGLVTGDIDGDSADDLNNDGSGGDGGHDVIINHGTVEDDLDGDNAAHDGGDDLIINHGTVGGDIQGDDNLGAAGSRGGADLIIINGTVAGSVYADYGVEDGGDDLVIIQNGAHGGDDAALYLDGGDGIDRLLFNLLVPDAAQLAAFTAQLAAADPARGQFTFNGQTFTWTNFEVIEPALVLALPAVVTTSASRGWSARLNRSESWQTAVYCTTTRLVVIGLDEANRAQHLFTIAAADLQAALAARPTAPIAQRDGQALSVSLAGEVVVNDSAGRYELRFEAALCGS